MSISVFTESIINLWLSTGYNFVAFSNVSEDLYSDSPNVCTNNFEEVVKTKNNILTIMNSVLDESPFTGFKRKELNPSHPIYIGYQRRYSFRNKNAISDTYVYVFIVMATLLINHEEVLSGLVKDIHVTESNKNIFFRSILPASMDLTNETAHRIMNNDDMLITFLFSCIAVYRSENEEMVAKRMGKFLNNPQAHNEEFFGARQTIWEAISNLSAYEVELIAMGLKNKSKRF